MKMRTGKIPVYILIAISLLAILFIYIELKTKVRYFAPYYKEKKQAAELTQKLFDKIKEKKINEGLLIDPINDPNETGLIGLQHSLITTEPGEIVAKLTTTNPNFSALVVELFMQTGLSQDDLVAVSFSGSFPALNIAVLAAIEVLKLKPIIITSVGSSMWGANEPEYTYLDMEKYLFDSGLIKNRSSYASVGGIDDIGRGLSAEGRNLIAKAIARNMVGEIRVKNLDEAIEIRMTKYKEMAGSRDIKAFVNIGGGAAALAGAEIPSGNVDRVKFSTNKGLAGGFLRMGVPVINLTDISHLARQYDLPITPMPVPKIARGNLFSETRYSTFLAVIFTIILLIILTIILKIDIDYYLKRRRTK